MAYKRLYKTNGQESLTEAGHALSREIQQAVQGIIKTWTDRGFSPRQVRDVATQATSGEGTMNMLWAWSKPKKSLRKKNEKGSQ